MRRSGASDCRRPEERDRFEDTTKCILCAACTTACPITWTNEEFVGPAAIVNAHRFIFDSRDQGAAERLAHSQQAVGRLALPDDLQLHRSLPARHQDHEGDRRGQALADPGPGLISA